MNIKILCRRNRRQQKSVCIYTDINIWDTIARKQSIIINERREIYVFLWSFSIVLRVLCMPMDNGFVCFSLVLVLALTMKMCRVYFPSSFLFFRFIHCAPNKCIFIYISNGVSWTLSFCLFFPLLVWFSSSCVPSSFQVYRNSLHIHSVSQ